MSSGCRYSPARQDAFWRAARKGHQGAYLRIPFEVEADWVARRTLAAEHDEVPDNQRAPLA